MIEPQRTPSASVLKVSAHSNPNSVAGALAGVMREQPNAELTSQLVQAAGRAGLIILACGIYSNVIRFLAPLTISDALLKEGFNLLEQALAEVAA